MAGAPGGWETEMRKELFRRKQRAERKEKVRTLLLTLFLFPFWFVFYLIDYAKNLHKFQS